MKPVTLETAAALGAVHGPVALAVLYAVGVAGGEWTGKDAELAAVVGCSLRKLQIVRTGLVAAAVLTYSSPQRGGPRVYRTLSAAAEKAGLAPRPAAVAEIRTTTPDEATAAPPLPRVVLGAVADGEEAPQPAPVPTRKPLPTDALFDQIVEFAYGGVRPAQGGRVAKLANEMHKAGLTAERLRMTLRAVIRKYASWRKVLDIGTVEACWRWILSPPATVDGRQASAELAADAMANGNPWVVNPQPEV